MQKDDVIYRQAAIDVFGDVHPLDYNAQTYLGKIKALPSAQPEQKTGKWIPVSERLPEIGEVVLLTIHEIGWNGCEYDSVVSGVYSSNKNHILAWMPLPEPWKEEQE